MTDDSKTLPAALGKAQIDGTFARQARAPSSFGRGEGIERTRTTTATVER